MVTGGKEATNARALLGTLHLKVILDSPRDDYRFEYYTTAIKTPNTTSTRLSRTYRLLDLIRGRTVQEPWGAYKLEEQTTLVTNLIRFSGYRISKVVSGWVVKCPACGHVMRGKHWEPVPRSCAGRARPKCRHRFTDQDVLEEEKTRGKIGEE